MLGPFGRKKWELKRKMDNFICVPVEYEGEFLWCVYEAATDQVIESFYFEDEALDYIEFVSSGGAFSGWTPTFMLAEFQTQSETDINEAFNSRL